MRIGDVVTEISEDREIKAAIKAKRAEIRLKYSLLADEEIAREIPALEARLITLKEALAEGESATLSIGVE